MHKIGYLSICFMFVHICIGIQESPNLLTDCSDFYGMDEKKTAMSRETMQKECTQMFLTMKPPHLAARNFTHEEKRYIDSLFRKLNAEATVNNRQKRSTGRKDCHVRYRREVRTAPYLHWQRYTAAVRRLKMDMSGGPERSRYDTIADIHGLATEQAHDGPNFLSWHRLYLLIYETALGVPIPYWDSTIDQFMTDPTKSILWTSKYFGNGFGAIETGPFAGFQTSAGPLIRNIGSDGSLFDKRLIPQIWSQTRLRDISDPTADEDNSLEGQHGGTHNWVDGQMNTLALAAHDPVFWLHHCFVDFIWEVFRRRQIARGINPEFDFVSTNRSGHGPNDAAFGIVGYVNRDGYSNRIANLVQYDLMPSCPYCGFSSDMYCHSRFGVCVSREQPLNTYQGNPAIARKVARASGMDKGKFGRVFPVRMRDKRVRCDSVTIPRKKVQWVKSFKPMVKLWR